MQYAEFFYPKGFHLNVGLRWALQTRNKLHQYSDPFSRWKVLTDESLRPFHSMPYLMSKANGL